MTNHTNNPFACRRFRNYVRYQIKSGNLHLNDKQLVCIAASYGLDVWTADRILNEQGY